MVVMIVVVVNFLVDISGLIARKRGNSSYHTRKVVKRKTQWYLIDEWIDLTGALEVLVCS